MKVHLRAVPLNPLDPSAIGIGLDNGTGSSHVGYIASELCKYLHPLMATEDIIDELISEPWQHLYMTPPERDGTFLSHWPDARLDGRKHCRDEVI